MKLIIFILICIVTLCSTSDSDIEFEISLMIPNLYQDAAFKVLNIAQEQLALGKYCDENPSYDCGAHHEYYIRRTYPNVKYNFVLNPTNFTNSIAIIGSLYSTDSILISKNIALPLKKPMISYASTANILSDPVQHEFFSRIIPSNDLQAYAMMDLCYRYNWRTQIGIVGSIGDYGESGVASLKNYANLYNMKIEYENLLTPSNITNALQELKLINCKYILIFINDDNIKELLYAAKELGMLNGDYVLIFSDISTYALNVVNGKISFKDETSSDNNLLEGIFTLDTSGGFWRRDGFLKERWSKYYPNTEYFGISTNIYDSFISLALAVDSLLSKFNDENKVFDGPLLQNELRSLEFLGTTGKIIFNKQTGDRVTSPYSLINVNSTLDVIQVTRWELGRKFNLLLNKLNLPGGKNIQIELENSVKEVIGKSGEFYPIPDSSTPPTPRYGSSLSMHTQESLLVVFGGRIHNTRRYNDFWVYDLKESLWKQVFSFKTPDARSEHVSFTWRSIDDEYFYSIFGGYNGIAILQEQWNYQFSLNSWSEYELTVVPKARLRTRAVNYNETTYLIGGESILSEYNDIWSFNHNTAIWSEKIVSNSNEFPERYDHCLSATNGTLFVWAGRSKKNPSGMNDTHIYTIATNTWKRIYPQNVPIIRYSTICEAHNGVIYMGLGYSTDPAAIGVAYGDFYKLNLYPNDGVYRFEEIAKPYPESWEGRDRITSVKYNGYFFIFSGWGPKAILNDFYRLSFEKESLEIVHPPQNSAPNLYDFDYVTIGSSMFIFGGNELKSTTTYSNNLFKLDLNDLTLTYLYANGNEPPPSSGHATAAFSDYFMIHGGISANGFMNDMWMYSVINNNWDQLSSEFQYSIPSSRAYHTAQIYTQSLTEKQFVYFFGGLVKEKILEDIWKFDVEEYLYNEIDDIKGTKPTNLVHMQSALLPSENLILLYGGEDKAFFPNRYIYSFDPNFNRYETFCELPSEYHTSRSRIVTSGDTLYIHGGSYFDQISDLFLQIKRGPECYKKIDYSSSVIKPERRYDHSILLFGHRLIIFGGVGAVPLKNMQSDITILNNFLEYRLGPICKDGNKTNDCYLCTPGTYHYLDRCLSCKKGYYNEKYGQTECVPCPPGFYGTLEGSASSKLCLPCPANTWQNNPGSSNCISCNSQTDYCPIGSSKKFSISESWKDNFHLENTEQPLDWPDNYNEVKKYQTISIIVCISIIVVMLILFILGFIWLRKCIFMFDFLFNEKHNYRIGEMKRKKTNPGGILTIVFCLIWITICFNTIFPAITNNISDEKTLTPTLSITSPIPYLVTTLNFTGSQELKCTSEIKNDNWIDCHPTLNFEFNFIKYDSIITKCMRTISKDENLYCNIRFIFKEFNTLSSNGYISIRVNEPNSFASYFGWNVGASSSLPIEKNIDQSLSKEINAPQIVFSRSESASYSSKSNLFRGKTIPITHYFKYIPTVFKQNNRILYGAHIKNSHFSLGSQVDSSNFNSFNGIAFNLILLVSENTLNINRQSKKEYLDLFIEIGGATTALLSILIIVLRFYESIQTIILNSNFAKNSKFIQKLFKFKKRRDFLEILDNIKNKKDQENKLNNRITKEQKDAYFIVDEKELKESFI